MEGRRLEPDVITHSAALITHNAAQQGQTATAQELYEEGRRGGDVQAATKLGALYARLSPARRRVDHDLLYCQQL